MELPVQQQAAGLLEEVVVLWEYIQELVAQVVDREDLLLEVDQVVQELLVELMELSTLEEVEGDVVEIQTHQQIVLELVVPVLSSFVI
jgi:hypothetical protein